jgi:hypothetical protein
MLLCSKAGVEEYRVDQTKRCGPQTDTDNLLLCIFMFGDLGVAVRN